MLLRKSFVTFGTVVVFLLVSTAPASSAGHALTGPAACDTSFSYALGTITPPLPAVTPSTKNAKVTLTSDLGSCVGENPALAIARFSMTATIRKGSSCTTEFSNDEATLHLVNARLKIKWIGVNGEQFGTSTAPLAAATIEETPAYVLKLVSKPIRSLPFRGEVITVDATIRNLLELFNECTNPTGAVLTLEFSPVAIHVG